MQNHIDRQRKPEFAYEPGSLQFQIVCVCACEVICHRLLIRLKTDLHTVQSSLFEIPCPLASQAHSAGNQVCVQSRGSGGGNELGEISSLERFTAGKTNVQDAKVCCFSKHTFPLQSTEFVSPRNELQRVRTI